MSSFKLNYFLRRQRSITSAAFVLLIAFAASMLLGLLRDRLLYARFYSCCTSQLDVYNAAFRVPDLFFRFLVTGALSAAFIPVFIEHWVKSRREAYQLASASIIVMSGVFLVLGMVVFSFAYSISRLIAPGFSSTQVMLMGNLVRWMIFAQGFFLLSNFVSAMLQAQKRFLLPALSPIVYNLSIIGGIVFGADKVGIFGPVLGVMVGAFLHFLIQFPALFYLGFEFSLPTRAVFGGVKKIFRLMIPRVFTLGLEELESAISVFLASFLPSGSLSLLYLSQHLYMIPVRLFGITLGQAMFPSFSKLWVKNKKAVFKKKLIILFHRVFYLTSFVTTVMLVLRVPIVRLFFGSRQFPWSATLTTSRLLIFLSPAILAQAGIQILARAFYSLQDTKTTFVVAFFALLLNVAVSFAGIYWLGWGVYSLVIAISVATVFQLITLFIVLMARINHFDHEVRMNFDFFSRLITINIFTGFAGWALMRALDIWAFDTSRVIGLFLLTGTSFVGSLITFIILSWFFRVPFLIDVFAVILPRFEPVFRRWRERD